MEGFDCFLAGLDGRIGDPLSIDPVASFRCIPFRGMEHRKDQRRVQFLFGYRSKHPDAAIAQLKNGFAHAAFLVAYLDPVQALDFDRASRRPLCDRPRLPADRHRFAKGSECRRSFSELARSGTKRG